MKALYFGCLLLAIGRILAQQDQTGQQGQQEQQQQVGDNETNIDATEANSPECMAELSKYTSCLAKFELFNKENSESEDEDTTENAETTENADTTENAEDLESEGSLFLMNSKESIQKYCAIMDSDECKPLVEDIEKPDSVCLKKGSNLSDYFSGFILLTIKAPYLIYCSKGNDGKLCPLSEYLQENTELTNIYKNIDISGNAIENIEEKISDASITSEQLKVIAKDCRDSKCNARMVSMYNFIANLLDMYSNKVPGGDTEEPSEEPTATESPTIEEEEPTPTFALNDMLDIDSIIEYYMDGQCEAIANDSGSESENDDATPTSGSNSSTPSSSSTPSGDSSSSGGSSGSGGSNSQSSSSQNSTTLNSQDDDAEGAAFTLKKITYSFITMVLLSSILLF